MTTCHSSNPQLVFDAAAHRYYLGSEPLPSVTTVLAAAGLLDYGFLGVRREEYLERGRAVHLTTQLDDEGSPAKEEVDAEILGYLRAWRAFRHDYEFTPSLIEYRIFHPQLKYAGTLDRLGRIRNGCEFLLDIKTGAAPAAARLQLAAYAGCLPHPRTRLRRCVELHENGGYRVIAYETRDYQRDFVAFAARSNCSKPKRRRKYERCCRCETGTKSHDTCRRGQSAKGQGSEKLQPGRGAATRSR